MQTPAVSVLIDTYNYGHYIETAVESVLAQDFPHSEIEILVVDDGSTDDTAQRVRRFEPRVKYLYKANGGQASAFNFGVERARGDIVAFLDADDYWLPTKLRRVVAEFQSRPETGLVYHRLLELDSSTKERKASDFVPISGYLPGDPEALFHYAPHRSSCLAVRRKFLEQLLPIPEGIKVQADGYIGSLIAFICPVLAVSECLGVYRIHEKNLYHPSRDGMSAAQKRRRVETTQALISGLHSWFASHGYNPSQPEVQAFLNRWKLAQAGECFMLEAPGRLRFFSHLLFYNRCYGPHLSRKLRMINRVNALGALIVGYKHFHLLEKWRLAAVAGLKRAFRWGGARGERTL